jgi:hypothetical protein
MRNQVQRVYSSLLLGPACLLIACGSSETRDEEDIVRSTFTTFEQFEAAAVRDPNTGSYLVEGDILFNSRDELRDYFRRSTQQNALTVNLTSYRDADKWTEHEKADISYCVSIQEFGSNYGRVVSAMTSAAQDWMASADVSFRHVPSEDGRCSPENTNVRFAVVGGSLLPFGTLAAANYPSASERGLYIASGSFGNIAPWSLEGVLRHELGHTLGLKHEHARNSASRCGEDSNWSALTPYDSSSVMHYPECGGTQTGDLVLTPSDREGARNLYGAPGRFQRDYRLPDLDGDRRADLFCQGSPRGRRREFTDSLTRLAVPNLAAPFAPSDGRSLTGWCTHPTAQLLFGDFNGDGRADVLCHDVANGNKWFRYGSAAGSFATSWDWFSGWCSHSSARLMVGDFNGDGRSDLLCHDVANGNKWFQYADANGRFNSSNWDWLSGWCSHSSARLMIGDFNGDGRSDLLCHDVSNGNKWFQYADSNGRFNASSWDWFSGWCSHGSARLMIGDFNGDGRSDLLCNDVANGNKWVQYADPSGRFNWSTSEWFSGWCSHGAAQLMIGDMNGDGRDDLLCHDLGTGYKWASFTGADGRLNSSGWGGDLGGGWCRQTRGTLF